MQLCLCLPLFVVLGPFWAVFNFAHLEDNLYVVGLFRNQGSYNTIQKQIANDEFTFFDGSGMDMNEF